MPAKESILLNQPILFEAQSYYARKDKNHVFVLRQITIKMTAKFTGVHHCVFHFPPTMQAHIMEILV